MSTAVELASAQPSRGLLRIVLDTVLAGVAVLRGREFTFELVNPAYQAIAPRRRFVGRSVAEAWPELASQTIPLLERVTETGESFHADDMRFEIERDTPGALEEIFVTFTYQPIPPDDGGRPGMLVTIIETTAQVQALRRAEEGEARADAERDLARARAAELEAVLDAVPAAVFVTRNGVARRIDGKRVLRFLGAGALETPLPEQGAAYRVMRNGAEVPPQDLPLQLAASRGVEVRDWECNIAFEQRATRHLLGYATPLAEGGAVGAFIDITERKRDEEQLRYQLDLNRGITQNAADSIFVTDEQGRVTFVNPEAEEVFGFFLSELKGQVLHDVIHHHRPDGRTFPMSECPLGRIYSRGETVREQEDVFFRKDRTMVAVSYSHAPLEVNGRRVGAVLITRDITERKLAVEALRQADRHKNEFLGVLSHELRNPLAPIRNALHVLDRAPPGSAGFAHAKAVVSRQVDHLTRLVDDLLDVTRVSRGKIQLHRSRFDLRELVQRTAEDHRPLLSERGITLDVRLPPGPLALDADLTRIAQVMGNLLQNGEKFTNDGGLVTVEVERDGDAASIRVRDTGVGIASEMLGRVFEPFAQADDSLHRSRGGLGLGLALVKTLVELHGGTVEAKSDGIGRGTEFRARLPLASGQRPTQQPPRGPAPVRPRKILIVEDNLDAAETLRVMLELAEHEVQVAYDGHEGIEKACAFRPDVILCDIGLPLMDGYAVARAIRSNPDLSSTVLIAITGYALPDDQRRAAQAGFDRHIAKPASIAQIEDALSTAARTEA